MSYHSVVIVINILFPHPHGALGQAFETHLGGLRITKDRGDMMW